MIRRWVEAWKNAAPVLEELRRKEIREGDNLQILASLEGAFNQALHSQPMRTSSGMVEMQKWFAKLRR